MFFKKKIKKYQFEKILDRFKPYKKDYALIYEQENDNISVKIESLIKPSKPPKRATMSLKTSEKKESSE
jgi:hypothetical protein